MSFSKARIHRFNDDIPCAPPPGAYNPEKIDKSVGPIIHKSERFTENYKLMIHASSTESVCSITSEKGTSSTTNFATFKTPKIPSTYRSISRTDVVKRGTFSHSKAASTDFINKKCSYKEHEMNPLKYSLHMLQDELAIEKSKNQELIAELHQLNETKSENKHLLSELSQLNETRNENQQLLVKLNQLNETTSEAEHFTEYLVNTVIEKNNFIDLLTEKCRTLQQISVQSFESYQSYMENMHEVLRVHYAASAKTDSSLAQLIERYEKLIAEYEQDIESFFIFLVDLQQKQSNKGFDRALLDNSSEQCNLLLETLKETERGRRNYEIIMQEMQKVVNVLSGRVRESDKEVEKTYDIISTLNQEKTKLCTIIRNKEEEITAMRDVVDSVSKKFFNEVRDTEEHLSTLIDEFKEKAAAEKEKYELELSRRDSMITELLKVNNAQELRLQEAIDEIELSKCREETLRQNFDSVQCALRDRSVKFQNAYEECCEKLRDLERTYESGTGEARTKPRNDSIHTLCDLVRKIVDSLIRNNLLSEDVESRFDGVENFEEQMSVLRESLVSSGNGSEELAFLPPLIDAVSLTFLKLAGDNNALKNNVSRLRDDFIEKCDECGQLTKLLQLSEKKVENLEKKTIELTLRLGEELETVAFESNAKESELIIEKSGVTNGEDSDRRIAEIALKELNESTSNLSELQVYLEKQYNQLAELEAENSSFKQQSAVESNVKESDSIIEESGNTNGDDLDRTTIKTALKEERMKNEELEERVAALEKLIEKLEAEKKSTVKNDPKVIRKNSKHLTQRNQEVKSKIAVLQPTKNSRDLVRKSGLLTEGKENQVINRNNETFEIRKTVPAEVPMNSTYVVLSPKVSRI